MWFGQVVRACRASSRGGAVEHTSEPQSGTSTRLPEGWQARVRGFNRWTTFHGPGRGAREGQPAQYTPLQSKGSLTGRLVAIYILFEPP
jgi:hypothetical protein